MKNQISCLPVWRQFATALALLSGAFCAGPAAASPWLEVGDSSLRSDIEMLAESGAINSITTQWPLPWGSILRQVSDPVFDNQPEYLRLAAQRLRDRGRAELDKSHPKYAVVLSATNEPAVVRGFDAGARETGRIQFSAEWITDTSALRLQVGAKSSTRVDKQVWDFDGSYVAQRIWDTVLYAGYMSHWWGPGWISALSLSNNARPFAQVGISRASTDPIKFPVLDLLGPWHFEAFMGLLDGPRIARNTLLAGVRVVINPLPGLELGAARTTMLCGSGHPCKPIAALLNTQQSMTNVNDTNDEGLLDIKYSNSIAGVPFSIYTQIMFEDFGLLVPIGVSHLYGATVWVPIGDERVRFTIEYANTVPTYNTFTFGDNLHGNSYNNPGYPDGMRYRGRTLGASVDSDSQLTTIQASWTDRRNRTFTFSYHNAFISHPLNTVAYGIPPYYNIVTTAPVKINIVEGRASFPFGRMFVDVAARLQDDQPRPDKGFTGAVEAALRVPM